MSIIRFESRSQSYPGYNSVVRAGRQTAFTHMNVASSQQQLNYWDNEYKELHKLPPPSQFAAFICQEAPVNATIIEFGCGSGRDSIFFAEQGFTTVGIDASASSIFLCKKIAAERGLPQAIFVNMDGCDSSSADAIRNIVAMPNNTKVIIYARFFIHAINSEQEEAFLSTASILCENGGILACEFRTPRDSRLEKQTKDHYRRFVSPHCFINAASKSGFTVTYAVEGFGFAKYKRDDAYVCRLILTRSPQSD